MKSLNPKSTVTPITKSIQALIEERATKTLHYSEASPAMADEQRETVSFISIVSRSGAASASAFVQKPAAAFERNGVSIVTEGTNTRKPRTGRGTEAMSCHSTWLAPRTTIVTLTIIGGTPEGRGFTKLQQRDKAGQATICWVLESITVIPSFWLWGSSALSCLGVPVHLCSLVCGRTDIFIIFADGCAADVDVSSLAQGTSAFFRNVDSSIAVLASFAPTACVEMSHVSLGA